VWQAEVLHEVEIEIKMVAGGVELAMLVLGGDSNVT
jgi:hypothetical protein